MNEEHEIILSTLPKTWIFDLDGTLVKHNGYKIDGKDTLLPGVKKYLAKISPADTIIILTARKSSFKDITVEFLKKNNVRYDIIIFDMPVGERILINDRKPSGLNMSIAINLERNEFNIPKYKEKL